MHSFVRALLAASPFVVAACGGGGGGDGGSGPGRVASSVSITPATVDTLFSQGATVDLDATVLDQQDAVIAGAPVTWSSANAGVAAVNAGSGVVTAGAAGNAPRAVSITVSVNGASGVTATRSIPVRQKLAALDLPPTASVAAGATVTLAAAPRDANGNAIAGLGGITWGSANGAVATVDASGVVSGIAAGTAKIGATLTADGAARTDTTVVTVSAPGSTATVNTTAASFSPSTVTINRTGRVTFNIGGGHDLRFNPGNPAAISGLDLCSSGVCTTEKTFDVAGNYGFHCTIHGGPNTGMSGNVIVNP